MTRKKQYKKRLPTVLPPAPRTGAEPEDVRPPAASPPAAPVLPTPREPEGPPAPQPRAVAAPTTADFVREMREKAGDADSRTTREAEEHAVEAPPPQTRSRTRPLALAGVLVAGVVAGALAYGWTTRDGTPPDTEGGWAAPVGLEAGEGYVETRVHGDGTMEVRQWIRADEPLERLRLRVPRVTSAGQLAADSIEVLADGVPVSGRTEISYFNAGYDLGGATEVEVRYRLVGAIERSDSAAGRALAVATGLETHFSPAPAREVRVVKAPEVLSLACAPSVDSPPVPCGTPDSAGAWHVDLAGERMSERVVASLTVS